MPVPKGFTRITGPGCDLAPHRIPIADRWMLLILGAELIDGDVHTCLYRAEADVTGIGDDDDPESWRPCIYQSVHVYEKVRLDCGCRAGRLCTQHCGTWGREWWRKAMARDGVREWRPWGSSDDPPPYDKDLESWPTPQAAVKQAKAKGLPRVRCHNGHGRTITIIDIEDVWDGMAANPTPKVGEPLVSKPPASSATPNTDQEREF